MTENNRPKILVPVTQSMFFEETEQTIIALAVRVEYVSEDNSQPRELKETLTFDAITLDGMYSDQTIETVVKTLCHKMVVDSNGQTPTFWDFENQVARAITELNHTTIYFR